MRPINLLPPEASERSQKRRRRVGLILIGVAYLAVLGLVAVWWQTKAQSAEDDLAEQLAANADLEVRIAQISEARDLRRRLEDGVERINTVLEEDVAWGRLLNDLGRVIPDRTWLANFTGVAQTDEELPGVYGALQMSGTAFDYPDVSSWIRALNSDRWPAVGLGWVQGSSRNELFDGVPVVEYSSNANLTDAALSDRSSIRIPEVPE